MRPKLMFVVVFALTLLFAVGSAQWDAEEEDEDNFDDERYKAVDTRYRRLVKKLERIVSQEKQTLEAIEFLKAFNRTATLWSRCMKILEWVYDSNLTSYNAEKKNNYSVKFEAWTLKQAFKAQKMKTSGLNKEERRIMKFIRTTAVLKSKKDREDLASAKSHMQSIVDNAQVVLKSGRRLPGETGIIVFFLRTQDYDKLADVWKGWRDATGRKYKSSYVKMVRLLNKGAKENGFKDYGYYEWFTDFEDPKFNEKIIDFFHQIKPLYEELHAYVRYKLSKKYAGRFNPRGPIPAHLFGNVWAQRWHNIFPLVKPYKNVSSIDITSVMKAQNWTVHRMFKTAENFFTSIGLYAMTPKFWTRSMFTNPGNRPVECHASAWDFGTLDDFRIEMCTEVNENHLITIHHEMGHVQYFMSYRKQPNLFRLGANSGFHEAIGDTIALSVASDDYYRKVGLMKSQQKTSEKAEINVLMKMALQKIPFIPFGLLVDSWRWKVFNGTFKPKDYNKGWWKLRLQLQGIIPPVNRSESDFDAGSKYHVPANMPYIRYFTSFIMQFQFYEAMCKKSGYKGPLHQCNFYQSKKAGQILKSMLKLGRSRPWPEAMKVLTGQREIRLDSLNRYFDPLRKWLVKYRKAKGYPVGW